MRRLFVTGTDTGIGKTVAACALIRLLVEQGYAVAAMKPVASGCISTPAGLRNEDALALMQVMNVDMRYEQVNPYAFEPAIAPHIAADAAGIVLDLSKIAAVADSTKADLMVIEGAGGWCVPLGEEMMMVDLVRALRADVILVAGMKLGCINHALLTARQITQDGCQLAGWIANGIDPNMGEYQKNLKSLLKLMHVPLLAEISWGRQVELIEQHWNEILKKNDISY